MNKRGDTMNYKLAEFLKEARLFSGLKQQEVGIKLGYKANTISSWESGRTEPDINTLLRLCDLYQVDFNCFLNRDKNPNTKTPILTSKEIEHIQKYRQLDNRGRKNVDETLEREFFYCSQTEKKSLQAGS